MSFCFTQQFIDDSLKQEKALAWIAEEIRDGFGVSNHLALNMTILKFRSER